MAINVIETTDYGMFKVSDDYRKTGTQGAGLELFHHNKRMLMIRIESDNRLKDNPITINRKGVVRDGYKRLVAAIIMKLPIFYEVVHDPLTDDWDGQRVVDQNVRFKVN